MPTSPWIAALLALFIWWFSTGAILWRVKTVDRDGGGAHIWSVIFSLPLLILGLHGLTVTAAAASVENVYLAFLSALAVWGWVELAFLSGVVTGPHEHPCPDGARNWERFLRAWGSLAYHEILLATGLVFALILLPMAQNDIGIWTYIVLYVARLSAKLNLFFGVPWINTEFLPLTLTHLKSHFRRRSVGWFFPASITLLSLALACWLERLWTATTPPEVVGFALLTTLTGLAIIEHWFMVVPLPDEKLWRWMLPAPNHNPDTRLTTHEG